MAFAGHLGLLLLRQEIRKIESCQTVAFARPLATAFHKMQRQIFNTLARTAVREQQRQLGESKLIKEQRPNLVAGPSRLSPFMQHARCISDEAKQKIDKAIAASPVVLFMKGTQTVPQCGFSRAVVQILDVQGVPSTKLKTYNVLEDAELREAIKEYSNWPTIPQVYVKGEFLGGCDIVLGMHQSGELEKTLADSGIIEAPPASA